MKLIDLIKEDKIYINALDDEMCNQLIEEIKDTKDNDFSKQLKCKLESCASKFKTYDHYSKYYWVDIYNLKNLYAYLKAEPFKNYFPELSNFIKLSIEQQDKLFELGIAKFRYYELKHYTAIGRPETFEKMSKRIVDNMEINKEEWDEISTWKLNLETVKKYKDKLNLEIMKKNDELDKEVLEEIGGVYKPNILQRLICLLKKEETPTVTYAINENEVINQFKKLNAKVIIWNYTTYYGDGLAISDWDYDFKKETLSDFATYELDGKYIITNEKQRAMIILDINDQNKAIVELLFTKNYGKIN